MNIQYGTDRRNAYKIIEDSLNLRDTRVFDTVQDENGNEKRVLNQKETILAQQKQTAIKEAFRDWIWKDPNRRERLCRMYNDTYNCIRPREYDGSHLRFVGMNPELNLRPHQKNAVARILYGGNTLLAHCVGAGKTAVMIASAMEKIRIGLGHKALLAVPNHLTEQTAAEFLRFYPGAKILVATKRDFETKNRKRFMGRIATGDYDAIIMGHSQFEKIPVSKERHLDCPWRPSDLQQRDGRILRQGNSNPEVEVIRYITQNTFDAYSYQLVENKQKFIAQVCTSKSPARGAEDLDEMALSYAEVKALAAGNPAIREKMNLDVEVSRLKLLKSNWQSERYRLERRVGVELPGEISRLETRIRNMDADIQLYNDHKPSDAEGFSITLMDNTFDKRTDAGERLMKLLSLVHIGDSMKAGTYCGFTLRVSKPDMLSNPRVEIQGSNSYFVELGESPLGNIQRIENAVEGIVLAREKDERSLTTARGNLADAKAELDKPWALEQELQEKSARLTELNIELDVGGSDSSAAALADDDDEPEPSRSSRGRNEER